MSNAILPLTIKALILDHFFLLVPFISYGDSCGNDRVKYAVTEDSGSEGITVISGSKCFLTLLITGGFHTSLNMIKPGEQTIL